MCIPNLHLEAEDVYLPSFSTVYIVIRTASSAASSQNEAELGMTHVDREREAYWQAAPHMTANSGEASAVDPIPSAYAL